MQVIIKPHLAIESSAYHSVFFREAETLGPRSGTPADNPSTVNLSR